MFASTGTAQRLTWREPFRGWNFSFDVTRTATDTSGDDLMPDVNSSAGFKADFRANQLAFATSYKYDIKTTSDNAETFDAKVGWLAPRWDVTVTYTFNKTFSAALNEGYTISIAFKYNL
jgi:predicted porin